MQRNLRLIKTGRASLSITVPADFIREFGLSVDDTVEWESSETMAVLKFFKVTRTETPALRKAAEGECVATE